MKTEEETHVRGLHVTITASHHEVFAYLADIENLPRWAGRFCAELEISTRGWHAWTSFGDLFVELEAHERGGVVDLRFGSEQEALADVPLRIWPRPDGGTLVGGWLVRAPGQSAECFARQTEEFADALETLARRWKAQSRRLCA